MDTTVAINICFILLCKGQSTTVQVTEVSDNGTDIREVQILAVMITQSPLNWGSIESFESFKSQQQTQKSHTPAAVKRECLHKKWDREKDKSVVFTRKK